MRRIIPFALLALALTACESSRTIRGKDVSCAGLSQDRVPGYTYKPSIRNIALGVFFFQSIVPPLVVALNEYECPVR